MKLSEAMILGSTLGRHIGILSISEKDGEGCALQLAALAVGKGYTKFPWTRLVEFQSFLLAYVICPSCGARDSLHAIISTHLNDDHGWPIDKIADFVRSVEPAEPAPAAAEQQVAEAQEDSNVLT